MNGDASKWTTILLACIPMVPTAVVLAVQQIKNNEQQNAHIHANELAIASLRNNLFSENENTPLSRKVLRLEDQIGELSRALAALGKRIDDIDVSGTRALGGISQNQTRGFIIVDRLSERVNSIDQRLTAVEATQKAIQADVNQFKLNSPTP